MKAITIHQPFAELIARGIKTIETRSWKTLHRGPIAIHAGIKSFRRVEELYWGTALQGAPYQAIGLLAAKFGVSSGSYKRGGVIAIAELVGIEPIFRDACFSKANRDFGDFTPGRWAWRLENVRRLEQPIPARGKQGLWEWPEGDSL